MTLSCVLGSMILGISLVFVLVGVLFLKGKDE